MLVRIASLLLLSLLIQQPAPAVRPAASRQFMSGYTGTRSLRPEDDTRAFFRRPPVLAVLARLEGGPLQAQEVSPLLDGSGVTVDQLVHVGLLRRDGGRLAIAFAYFTASDMARIYALADRLAPSLAGAFAARRKDFDRIFGTYPVPTVPRGQVAFVLLSGFCLNWDGLYLTRTEGYRRPIIIEGPDYHYGFWATEAVAGRDYHGVYWGSSTDSLPAARVSFSSFGDPDSEPRMNLPDLVLYSADEMAPAVRAAAERVGLHDEERFNHPFQRILGTSFARNAAAVLYELRRTPQTRAQLARSVDDNPGALLDLLAAIHYVSANADGAYHLLVPVFDDGDQQMVGDAIALGRTVMRGWLREHFPEIRRALAGLTATRNGVPFEALVTQIWHEIFGPTTRELVRAAMTADPRGAEVPYKGSFSVVWRPSLYARNLD